MNLVISVNVVPMELNHKRTSDYVVLQSVLELEEHLNGTPRVYDKVFVDDICLDFSPAALNTFKNIITNGFLNFDTLVYVTSKNKVQVERVFNNIFIGIKFDIVDVVGVDINTVTSVVNGSMSGSSIESYSTINKVKLRDYVEGKKNELVTKTDDLIMDDSVVTVKEVLKKRRGKRTLYIYNFDRYYTTYYMLLVFNNLKRNENVFMMEFNKYNYLSDYIMKIGEKNYKYNINEIDSNKSCLYISKDINKSDYNCLFDYIYNNTAFDTYIRVIDNISINMNNVHYVINPVVDNVLKLIEVLYKAEVKKATIILMYKGFIGINELTQREVFELFKSNLDIELDLTTIILKEKEYDRMHQSR